MNKTTNKPKPKPTQRATKPPWLLNSHQIAANSDKTIAQLRNIRIKTVVKQCYSRRLRWAECYMVVRMSYLLTAIVVLIVTE